MAITMAAKLKTKSKKKENSELKLDDSSAVISYAKKLFKAADALRKNIDAAEYKHTVLGLIFLKYISDAFDERHRELIEQKDQGADPEEKSEYLAVKIFWVPEESRWSKIKDSAKKPEIGKIIDDAGEIGMTDAVKQVITPEINSEKITLSSKGTFDVEEQNYHVELWKLDKFT